MMLDENKQKFDVANSSFHLANRPVFSINEDRFGCIWLTTDRALVRLDAEGNTISFTEQDGLSCTSFLQNATLRYSDRLYFGTTAGFVAFTPLPSYSNYRNFKSNLVISDILIDGTSVQSLDSTAMARIISCLPAATREISIPASAKTFNIEFSLLNYANPNEIKYAYLLNGYDSEWQYVDGSTHSARYQHLPPGISRAAHSTSLVCNMVGIPYIYMYNCSLGIRNLEIYQHAAGTGSQPQVLFHSDEYADTASERR